MGRRGDLPKFEQMGQPKFAKLDWDKIEQLHRSKLSEDMRNYIEHAFAFYSSRITSEKLSMVEIRNYAKKINQAYYALEALPEEAMDALGFDELAILQRRAAAFSRSGKDDRASPWDFLVYQIRGAFGFLNENFPKTKLTETSLGLPKENQVIKEVLKQGDVKDHLDTDSAFALAICRSIDRANSRSKLA